MPICVLTQGAIVDNGGAVTALGALAQKTRLATFRLLIAHEPAGLAAGDVARLLDIPQNTMSTHLAVLTRAGLARGERQSRSVIYRADLSAFRTLMLHLINDCCAGAPELRAPLVAELVACRPATQTQGETCDC